MKHDGVEVKIVAGLHKGKRGILTGMFWGRASRQSVYAARKYMSELMR